MTEVRRRAPTRAVPSAWKSADPGADPLAQLILRDLAAGIQHHDLERVSGNPRRLKLEDPDILRGQHVPGDAVRAHGPREEPTASRAAAASGFFGEFRLVRRLSRGGSVHEVGDDAQLRVGVPAVELLSSATQAPNSGAISRNAASGSATMRMPRPSSGCASRRTWPIRSRTVSRPVTDAGASPVRRPSSRCVSGPSRKQEVDGLGVGRSESATRGDDSVEVHRGRADLATREVHVLHERFARLARLRLGTHRRDHVDWSRERPGSRRRSRRMIGSRHDDVAVGRRVPGARVCCEDARMGLDRSSCFTWRPASGWSAPSSACPAASLRRGARRRATSQAGRAASAPHRRVLLERGHGVSVDLFGERVSDPRGRRPRARGLPRAGRGLAAAAGGRLAGGRSHPPRAGHRRGGRR